MAQLSMAKSSQKALPLSSLTFCGILIRISGVQQSSTESLAKGVLCAGIPVLLKDGDVILFGSDSLLTVQLTPAFGEQTTVEQHLRSECELLMQRVRVQPPFRYDLKFG